MRLVLFDDFQVGVLRGDEVVEVSHLFEERHAPFPRTFLLRAIARFDALRPAVEAAAAAGRGRPLSACRLLPPALYPTKVLAAPVNYKKHQAEMSAANTIHELGFFLKAPSSIIGPGDTIRLPFPDRRTDHEVELAAVIGREASRVKAADALRHVFAYTILVDVTVRGGEDRSTRKSFDTFTPIGPALVTADEIPDPQDLRMRLWLNGELKQDASTRDMIEDVAGLIQHASSIMTLLPGDILSTGTPEGVSPLKPGDVVDVEIDRVGRMRLNVAAGWA
jgi:2-keto-4-pentenoate hydratase/2-oxohepta-3-ene-1,7-dioic acid hydratase in catechol pathway